MMTALRLPALVRSLLCAAVVTAAKAGAADPDAIEEMNTALYDRHRLKKPLGADETPANRLFSLPDWRERMGRRLAELVNASRVSPEEMAAYYRVTPYVLRRGRKSEPLQAGDGAAAARVNSAGQARVKLAFTLDSIAILRDRRCVPLIAPVLAERTPTIFGDDYSITAPQDRAARALRTLSSIGMIDGKLLSEDKMEVWRKWWQDNRAKFDPVPEALRAIDEQAPPPGK